MEFQVWMDSMWGWGGKQSEKPQDNHGSYSLTSGYSMNLRSVGMVIRDLLPGNIVQLESQATGKLLRVNMVSGKIDFNGVFGVQSQFIVNKTADGMITFRCAANPKNFLVLRNGKLHANGTGDPLCRFRYHLVDGQLMRFESVHNPNRFISVFKKYGSNEDVKELRRSSSGASSSMSMRSVDSRMSTESTSGRGQAGLFAVVLLGHTNQSYAS